MVPAVQVLVAQVLRVVAATSRLSACIVPTPVPWRAQAEHGGFYEAVANGEYAKRGLDVKIVQGGPGVNVPQLLAAGGLAVIPRDADLKARHAASRAWNETWLAAFFHKPCNHELFVLQSLNMEVGIALAERVLELAAAPGGKAAHICAAICRLRSEGVTRLRLFQSITVTRSAWTISTSSVMPISLPISLLSVAADSLSFFFGACMPAATRRLRSFQSDASVNVQA